VPWLKESFIHLLAAKHGFNTLFLYHSMNRAANVTYYGFIAYLEIEVKQWPILIPIADPSHSILNGFALLRFLYS
jgi:hypothetical protein